jgi:hypothetical protein
MRCLKRPNLLAPGIGEGLKNTVIKPIIWGNTTTQPDRRDW